MIQVLSIIIEAPNDEGGVASNLTIPRKSILFSRYKERAKDCSFTLYLINGSGLVVENKDKQRKVSEEIKESIGKIASRIEFAVKGLGGQIVSIDAIEAEELIIKYHPTGSMRLEQ